MIFLILVQIQITLTFLNDESISEMTQIVL